MAITTVRDSDCCSCGDSSPSKFLLVAFLVFVLAGGDLARSDSLLLSSALLSPSRHGGAGIVVVVSSSWWSDPCSSASYSASFSNESPPSVCCWKRYWRLMPSPHCGVTGSRPLPLLDNSWNPPGILCYVSISSTVSCFTSNCRPVIIEGISSSHSLAIQGSTLSQLTNGRFNSLLKVLLWSNYSALMLGSVFQKWCCTAASGSKSISSGWYAITSLSVYTYGSMLHRSFSCWSYEVFTIGGVYTRMWCKRLSSIDLEILNWKMIGGSSAASSSVAEVIFLSLRSVFSISWLISSGRMADLQDLL